MKIIVIESIYIASFFLELLAFPKNWIFSKP